MKHHHAAKKASLSILSLSLFWGGMGVGSSDLACAAMVGIPAGVRSGDGLAGGLDPPDAAATACVGVGASAVGGNRGGQAA